ncbi:MAG: Brp/Blh family beta-carotene 15,15'-monooxygenase [Sediminicola sp.]|jgi:Brp/Blh family beta-carotene 15,15'-monooxygenase|tara:strand:+ start:997 stop:1881 length:885 start_codon:yes stop_codon:yes gene_type:complete
MNFKRIAIFITLLSLWLSNYFSNPSQQILALCLIFSVGILHGSNDLAIIHKMNGSRGVKNAFLLIGSYVLTVFIAALLFYKLPELALALFILFSGYHFGEQHWSDRKLGSTSLKKSIYLFYGLTILFLLFTLNSLQTSEIINNLTSQNIPEIWYNYGLIGSSVTFTVFLFFLFATRRLTVNDLFFELFLLLVFAIVFNFTTLLWAFAIYFIYWHSIPSILEQLSYLYGDKSFRSFKLYLRSSSIIWLISVSAIFVLFYIVRNNADLFLALFFAFLGAITFAHSFIIMKMFTSEK